MLIHIAKKEIFEHINSFRFIVAFLFILTIFVIMMFTRHFEYQAKYHDYLLRVKAQEESLTNYANYNRVEALAKPIVPPSPMEIIVAPAVTGDVIETGPSLDDDPLNTISINLDIIALVGLLGSLLALLLSYDSVNREVHERTLRLLLSFAVSRIKIIFGKILGGSTAALLPIVSIFILISLWLAITGANGWDATHWVSFLGIFLISIIYIMFFYCLGAFLSSIIIDQVLSALSCFAIWSVFAIIIPTVSPYIARAIIKIPDSGQVQREISHIMNVEREDAIRNKIQPLLAQGLSFEEAWVEGNLSELNFIYFERIRGLQDNLRTAATRQVKFSVQIACLSPYSLYLFSIEELSGLGISRFQHLMNVIKNWQDKAEEYLNHKYAEARRLNPSHTIEDKLDVSDGPRFKSVDPSFSYKFSHALPYLLLLMAYFLLPIFLFLFTFNSKRTLL